MQNFLFITKAERVQLNVLRLPDTLHDQDSLHLNLVHQYPLVAKYIGELRREVQEKYGVSFEKHITELARIRDEARAKGAWSAATNAEVARGKAAGLYIDQKLIMTGNLDQLSEEELESRMKQILDDNKLITVEPSPSSESHQEEKHSDQKIPHHPDRMN